MASKKKNHEKKIQKKKSKFPYKSVILAIIVLGGVYFVSQHGSWASEFIKKTLKEYKVCDHTHMLLNKTKDAWHVTSEKIEEQFPGLQQKIVETSEPYVNLSIDLFKIGRNFLCRVKDNIVESYPVVMHKVQTDYIPGLVENCQIAIHNIYSTSVLYFNRSLDYLKNEVFVGQMSPENIQKTIVDLLNATREKVVESCTWVYNKIQEQFK